jgi:hypothetical protein
MRFLFPLTLAVALVFSVPAHAQDADAKARKHRVGTIKLISGIAAAGAGLVLFTTAGDSDSTAYQGLGADRDRFVALGLAGGGGFLIWNGLSDRAAASRMSVGISVTPKRTGVFLGKRW